MNGAAASIKYGIVCEDIRREDNGKLIIAGMYGRDIALSALPAAMALCFLIGFDVTSPGDVRLEIEVLFNEGVTAHATGDIRFAANGRALVTLPPTIVSIPDEGELTLRAKISGEIWTELWRGPVSLSNADAS